MSYCSEDAHWAQQACINAAMNNNKKEVFSSYQSFLPFYSMTVGFFQWRIMLREDADVPTQASLVPLQFKPAQEIRLRRAVAY